MQKIKLAYVTFEQAKLLKEKEFLEDSFKHYSQGGTLIENSVSYKTHVATHHLYANSYDFEIGRHGGGDKHCIAAPEQWQVVEWLRLNHGIWIEIHHIKTTDDKFHIIIYKYGEEDYYSLYCENLIGYQIWDTPQKAYSAAFDYILNELL